MRKTQLASCHKKEATISCSGQHTGAHCEAPWEEMSGEVCLQQLHLSSCGTCHTPHSSPLYPFLSSFHANKSFWLILIASDAQPRHHFFRLILNLVLFSSTSRLPLSLFSSTPLPSLASRSRRHHRLLVWGLWLICKQESEWGSNNNNNLANNLTWLKCSHAHVRVCVCVRESATRYEPETSPSPSRP